MGLLLGCSALTLFEFMEFLCDLLATKLRNRHVTPVVIVN